MQHTKRKKAVVGPPQFSGNRHLPNRGRTTLHHLLNKLLLNGASHSAISPSHDASSALGLPPSPAAYQQYVSLHSDETIHVILFTYQCFQCVLPDNGEERFEKLDKDLIAVLQFEADIV